jgi:ABC-2 type transport system permease protein
LGGKTSKGVVRKINVLISLFAIFFYFVIISFQNVNMEQVQSLIKFFDFTTKPYNILALSFISDKLFFYALLLSILFTLIFYILADKLAFEPIQRKTSKNYKIKGYGSVIKALYRKDFKATLRYEQFLYFILYPIGFGIFFSFINKDYFLTIITVIPITTFYVALETAILTNAEVSNLQTILTFPVKLTTLLIPKIIIPTSINLFIVLGVFVFSAFKSNLSYLSYLIIPFTFLMFSMSSIIGMYFVTKNPQKSENMSKLFGIAQTFIIEGITISLSFGSMLPISFLINPQSSIKIKVISILVMLASITVSLLISILTFKKLRKILELSFEK